MHRSLKAALLGIGVVIGLPIAAFLTWDIVAFRPHVPEIRQILAQAATAERHPTPLVRRLIDANVKGNVSPHISRHLCGRLLPKRANDAGTRALWAIAVKLHFDPGERIALLAALSGLDRRAHDSYGRSLPALTDRETARVIAWTYSPSVYALHPEKWEQRADRLLQQARTRP